MATSGPVAPSEIVARLSSVLSLGNDVAVKEGTVRQVQYPAGAGAAVDITDHGRDAEAVLLSGPQGGVTLELVTGGNAGARRDFDTMLQSLQLA
jgi:hypothetical protein